MDRPWTPGPWTYTEDKPYTGSDANYQVIWDSPDKYDNTLLCDEQYYPSAPTNKHDAQLIALAPEMAEAILAWDGPEGWKSEMFLEDMAAKLRAIGAEDD